MREHLLRAIEYGAGGGGAAFVVIFRDAIHQLISAALAKWRTPSRPPPMPLPAASRADGVTLELLHQMIDMFRQELADNKTRDNSQFAILRDLVADLKALTQAVSGVQAQQQSDSRVLDLLARGRKA